MQNIVRVNYALTPNPRSRKFTADAHRFAVGGLYSFGSAAEAIGNPLGEALFSLPAVTNVLILPEFVTVTLASPSDWASTLERVLELLQDFAERPL